MAEGRRRPENAHGLAALVFAKWDYMGKRGIMWDGGDANGILENSNAEKVLEVTIGYRNKGTACAERIPASDAGRKLKWNYMEICGTAGNAL
jgi:hypothetical protein